MIRATWWWCTGDQSWGKTGWVETIMVVVVVVVDHAYEGHISLLYYYHYYYYGQVANFDYPLMDPENDK